jgi:ferritin-like metal-binding protein YciE
MKETAFYRLFVDLLCDLFDAEKQMIDQLPKMIQAASHKELKAALSSYLNDMESQVGLLREGFDRLRESPTERGSKPTQSLIEEAQEILEREISPAAKDAFIIINFQKIEHLAIAGYGSARALINHFKDIYPNEKSRFEKIAEAIEVSLSQKIDFDRKLTFLAEGNFFSEGINEEAEVEAKARRQS